MSKTCRRSLSTQLIRLDHRWPLFMAAYPGWQIIFARMDEDEAIDWDSKIIWLNCHVSDPLFRAAHAVAHLKLHYGVRDAFTDRQEDDASWIALMWLAWTSEPGRSTSNASGE